MICWKCNFGIVVTIGFSRWSIDCLLLAFRRSDGHLTSLALLLPSGRIMAALLDSKAKKGSRTSQRITCMPIVVISFNVRKSLIRLQSTFIYNNNETCQCPNDWQSSDMQAINKTEYEYSRDSKTSEKRT